MKDEDITIKNMFANEKRENMPREDFQRILEEW